jgi:hypothetical protein
MACSASSALCRAAPNFQAETVAGSRSPCLVRGVFSAIGNPSLTDVDNSIRKVSTVQIERALSADLSFFTPLTWSGPLGTALEK